MENNTEVIDLTQSFTYCRAPINLSSSIIELDDSINLETCATSTVNEATPILIECETDVVPALPEVNVSVSEGKPKKCKGTKKKRNSRNSVTKTSPVRERSPHYGDCPICRDPLGTHPMASTRCGHVYCIGCIERAVKIEKKCPTCRKPLRGATAYHPLFL